MQVKLTRNCMVDGKSREAGMIVETSAKVGEFLIAIGKAVASEPAPEPKKTAKAAPKSRPVSTRTAPSLKG